MKRWNEGNICSLFMEQEYLAFLLHELLANLLFPDYFYVDYLHMLHFY